MRALGMEIHFGKPKYRFAFRRYEGTIFARGSDTGTAKYKLFSIRRWFGISFRGRFFIGVMRLEPPTFESVPTHRADPLPASDAVAR